MTGTLPALILTPCLMKEGLEKSAQFKNAMALCWQGITQHKQPKDYKNLEALLTTTWKSNFSSATKQQSHGQAKGNERLLAFRQLTAALQEKKHKWVLLSYPWEGEADSKPQSHAMRVYMALVQRRLPVWMDIMGGVSGDLNLAMATAVQNAGVVMPCMSSEYERSTNCKVSKTMQSNRKCVQAAHAFSLVVLRRES